MNENALKPLHALLRKSHSAARATQHVQFDLGASMKLEAEQPRVQTPKQEELPWFRPEMRGMPHFERLDAEIRSYVQFAQLTLEEKLARDDLVARIKTQVNSVLEAEVHAYGSYASELASYYSDIDVGVETKQKIPMASMMRITQVLSERVGTSQYIQAKVPIVRGTCRLTLIDYDISFNNTGETMKDVQNALKCTAVERALILVIKAFLRQRGLNTPHTGGISGHILTQMVQAYTQNRLTAFPYKLLPKLQYATSLMEFLELYGILFNSKQVYIYRNLQNQLEFRCRGDKLYHQCQNQNQLVVVVHNSQDENVKDIAGGAFNFRTIRLSFEVNYFFMQQKSHPNESLLERLISVDKVGRFTREKSISISRSLDQSQSERSVVLDFENDASANQEEPKAAPEPVKQSPQTKSIFMSQYSTKKSRFNFGDQ